MLRFRLITTRTSSTVMYGPPVRLDDRPGLAVVSRRRGFHGCASNSQSSDLVVGPSLDGILDRRQVAVTHGSTAWVVSIVPCVRTSWVVGQLWRGRHRRRQ